ncbi:PKD domain-containing protein [Chitinophaga sp. HK235]|uniref:PKD domain-containing protein n=1 Tax=Chitinophaga sp. HK235 TaxID=2952571 RepID=UPI001BA533D5|nr:PKD domain-containing protein [Chitinophaga sp. HK235]
MKNRTNLKTFSGIILALFILIPFVCWAQGDQTAIKVKVTPSGMTTNAWLHLPDDYSTTNTNYPLIIFLHGLGEGGTDINAVLGQGLPKAIANGAKMNFTVGGKSYKFIVVSPQIEGGWAKDFMVQAVLEDIKARYRVDVSRVYLTGLSAGGYGTWNYVTSSKAYADNIAAIVPVSPAAISAEQANSLCNTIVAAGVPVWSFAGSGSSDAAFLSNMQSYEQKYNSCNPDVKAVSRIVYGSGHDAGTWDKVYNPGHTYQQPNIYEWMLQFTNKSVTQPVNHPPVIVLAKSSISVKTPVSTILLDGTASYAPNSRITKYRWEKISGPSQGVLISPDAASVTLSSPVVGSYVLSLTVTNAQGVSSTANATVTVNATGSSVGCNCKHVIQPGPGGGIYSDGNQRNVQPGDTICIPAGNYPYIQFFNYKGSPEKPLVFINCGGQVRVGDGGNYGLIFNHSQYFKVTGSGSDDKYGFYIDGVGKLLSSGLAMGKGCTDYEAERIEVARASAGVLAKINPDCDPINQYPNFAIRNLSFHDLYVHDIGGEGLYIGHTLPNGIDVTCSDGSVIHVLPPRIYNLKIYNVTTRNTGWDGIQVASAPEGVEIFNNEVYNFGTENKGSQQAGIIMGGESRGVIYDNKVIKGTGNAIEVFGTGLTKVYNNIISDCGWDGTATGQDAIFVDDRPTRNNYKPLQVYLLNNTVVNSRRSGIMILSTYGTVGTDNLLYNNLIVGGGSSVSGDRGFVNIMKGIEYKSSNNLYLANAGVAGFRDAPEKDFHLVAGSPAVDKGMDLTSYGITSDFDGDVRPYNRIFDVGADEYSGETPGNRPPVARAGNNISITLPVNAVQLDGSASSDPDGIIISYQWEKAGGPAATIESPASARTTVSGLVVGSYTFELTVTDNKGITAKDRVTVTVYPEGHKSPVANAGRSMTITLPASAVKLDGSASYSPDGQLVKYFWQRIFGDVAAQIISADKDIAFVTGLVKGIYEFMLTVTDDKGENATATVTLTVLDDNDHSSRRIVLFPNPSSDFLQLRLDEVLTDNISVHIYSITGQLIQTYTFKQGTTVQEQLDIRKLVQGIYMLQITNGKDFNETIKFVKS